ncbi:MAG: hypothetical protein ACT4OX_15335 [Actinomycetota bacterium]
MAMRPRLGATRRIAALAATLVAVSGALGALGAGAAGGPSRPADRDLSSYVLFALESIQLKGDDRAGRSEIRGGNIGVNALGRAERGEPRLVMCLGPGDGLDVGMDPHTQVVADTAKLGGGCDIWDVWVTQRERSGHEPNANSIDNGGWYEPSQPEPLVTNLPPFPSFDCVDGPMQTYTGGVLPPGSYPHVSIDGTVTLTAGTYTFCELHVQRHAFLDTHAGSVIRIERALRVPGGTIGGPNSCDAQIFVEGQRARDAAAISFGRDSTVFGQLWAPNADVNLGHTTDLFGHFWARALQS